MSNRIPKARAAATAWVLKYQRTLIITGLLVPLAVIFFDPGKHISVCKEAKYVIELHSESVERLGLKVTDKIVIRNL